jgi:nucleotide-binding universal stress UspA family protein
MAAPFQRLLLATEHTEFDAGAENLALELARRCGQPLCAVLPLVSNPEYEALAPEIAARSEQQAACNMTLLRDMAQARGVALDLHARRGPEPYREIVDEALDRASDLIVIRRRGKRSFLANLLLGEMVSKVVAHAPCSVLIVPRDASMWRRRILVAVEPGPQGLRLVTLAAAVATECDLPLSVICVTDDDPPQREAADRFVDMAMTSARQAGVTAEGQVLKGKPYSEIIDAVQRGACDLIVIGSRSNAHIHRAWIGSVAQKVIGLSEHPVLVVHF